jgi:hypothetical protein
MPRPESSKCGRQNGNKPADATPHVGPIADENHRLRSAARATERGTGPHASKTSRDEYRLPQPVPFWVTARISQLSDHKEAARDVPWIALLGKLFGCTRKIKKPENLGILGLF